MLSRTEMGSSINATIAKYITRLAANRPTASAMDDIKSTRTRRRAITPGIDGVAASNPTTKRIKPTGTAAIAAPAPIVRPRNFGDLSTRMGMSSKLAVRPSIASASRTRYTEAKIAPPPTSRIMAPTMEPKVVNSIGDPAALR